jgi:hypothetical protein
MTIDSKQSQGFRLINKTDINNAQCHPRLQNISVSVAESNNHKLDSIA